MIFGLEKSRAVTQGCDIIVRTDHRPLQYIADPTHQSRNSRLARWAAEMNGTQVFYQPGYTQQHVDALSRNFPIIEEEPTQGLMAAITESGQLNGRLWMEDESHALQLESHQRNLDPDLVDLVASKNDVGLAVDEKGRIIVPKSARQSVLRQYHNGMIYGAHMGVTKTSQLLSGKYFWPNMHNDVRDFISNCQLCQRVKPSNRPFMGQQFHLARGLAPFQVVGIDLIVKLPIIPSNPKGATMNLLVMIDHYSKWTEIVALKTKKASDVQAAFINNWFLRYSAPRVIVSDCGKEFLNNLIGEMMQIMQVEVRPTTGYSPQQNSIVERDNGKIKQFLKMYASSNTSWLKLLPYVQAALNIQPHTALAGLSPYEVVFGQKSNDPAAIMVNKAPPYLTTSSIWNVAQLIEGTHQRYREADILVAHHVRQHACMHEKEDKCPFKPGQQVWVKHMVKDPDFTKLRYHGPYTFIQYIPPATAEVSALDEPNTVLRVHPSRLKAALTRNESDESNKPITDQQTVESDGELEYPSVLISEEEVPMEVTLEERN